jgi:hypothetical protein
MPKLPRVAGNGSSNRPPEPFAGLIAAPLEGKKVLRAAKIGSSPRDSRTVGDALSTRSLFTLSAQIFFTLSAPIFILQIHTFCFIFSCGSKMYARN